MHKGQIWLLFRILSADGSVRLPLDIGQVRMVEVETLFAERDANDGNWSPLRPAQGETPGS